MKNDGNSSKLLRGIDDKKDQSYFLHQVTGQDLNRAIFPLGDLSKSEVRKIAADNNLVTSTKKIQLAFALLEKINTTISYQIS